MREDKVGAIVINSFALIVVLGMAYQARSQDATKPYPKMAPVEQYLMERNAEIPSVKCYCMPLDTNRFRRLQVWRS